MVTPARPLAKCVIRYIYEQAAETLRAFKEFLLGIIEFIDVQLAIFRKQLAQYDYLSRGEKFVWENLKKVEEDIRNSLISFINGPDARICPEFYEYFLDPAQFIFNNSTSSLSAFRERYYNMISYMDEIDLIILYWEQIQADLLATIDIIDDALFIAAQNTGEVVP